MLCLLRGCCSGFLGGFCGGGCLATALGLGRGCRRFTNEFCHEDAGHEKLGSVVIEINGRAFRIRGRDDPQSVLIVLDGLPFLHYLHNFLLRPHSLFLESVPFLEKERFPTPRQPLPIYRLEACDVLCLKALRALLYFEFHRLAFIQGLVPIHLNGGEVYENIFSGLALDEPVALRSIEPLHCSLFLHCTTSMLKLLCLSWSRGLVSQAPRQPPARQKKAAMCCRSPLNESKGNTRATNAIRKPITGKGLLSISDWDTAPPPPYCKLLIFRILGCWDGLRGAQSSVSYSSSASGWRLACPSPVLFFSQYFFTQASQLLPAAVSRPLNDSAAISAYAILVRWLESFGNRRTKELLSVAPVTRSKM